MFTGGQHIPKMHGLKDSADNGKAPLSWVTQHWLLSVLDAWIMSRVQSEIAPVYPMTASVCWTCA